MKSCLFSLLFVLILACAGGAQTIWYVDIDNAPGPGSGSIDDPFVSIQYAIAHEDVLDGHVVWVLEGTYFENIDFLGKAIIVKSKLGPDLTAIYGNHMASTVVFENGEGRDSVLSGFTITAGEDNYGGGICCIASSPTIINNKITGNIGWSGGGGIACLESEPLIQNNLILSNSTNLLFGGGGGIYLNLSDAEIINNVLAYNSADQGGALECDHSSPTMTNNTFYDNHGWGGVMTGLDSWPVITNSIHWSNGADEFIIPIGGHITVTYSDVQGGWPGIGNINAHPLIDPDYEEFFLMQDPPQPTVENPCVDAGDPDSMPIDGSTRTDGVQDTGIMDMGYHYRDFTLDVPGAYATIQEAIDAAWCLDLVAVAPGTYVENLNFLGKTIEVRSNQGADFTVIDGNDEGSVVVFENGEGRATSLVGFTITHGNAETGGGILCFHSSPTITRNTILGNTGHNGSGIYAEGGMPAIIANVIRNNSGTGTGGGIYCYLSAGLELCHNHIAYNDAVDGGGISVRQCSPEIFNNLIIGNATREPDMCGGGIYVWVIASPVIRNNTLAGNVAIGPNGRGGALCSISATPQMVDNIFVGNEAADGPEIRIEGGSTLTCSYSNVEGGENAVSVELGSTLNWGGGMLDEDPEFVTGPDGHYYLEQQISPCVDAGSELADTIFPDYFWTGTDEETDAGQVDMGFHFSYLSDSWLVPLWADTHRLPATDGGTAGLHLNAGLDNGDRDYILLGSISGTEPGIPLPGNMATLPLIRDFFTDMTYNLANSPVFEDFMRTLSPEGKRVAQVNMPPVPNAVGVTLYFAYALRNPWDFASNPISIEITP